MMVTHVANLSMNRYCARSPTYPVVGSFSDKVFNSVEKHDQKSTTKKIHSYSQSELAAKHRTRYSALYKAFVFSATGSYGVMYNSNGNLSFWH